jgi:hypothetical protein
MLVIQDPQLKGDRVRKMAAKRFGLDPPARDPGSPKDRLHDGVQRAQRRARVELTG